MPDLSIVMLCRSNFNCELYTVYLVDITLIRPQLEWRQNLQCLLDYIIVQEIRHLQVFFVFYTYFSAMFLWFNLFVWYCSFESTYFCCNSKFILLRVLFVKLSFDLWQLQRFTCNGFWTIYLDFFFMCFLDFLFVTWR